MKSTLKGMGKRPGSNPTGQGAHPGKRNVVKNAPGQIAQFGRDGFSERQSKSKAYIRKGQGSC